MILLLWFNGRLIFKYYGFTNKKFEFQKLFENIKYLDEMKSQKYNIFPWVSLL